MNNTPDLSAIINQNLDKLPGIMFINIKKHWDSSQKWKDFICSLDGDFIMDSHIVEGFQNENSPAKALIHELSVRAMTIQQFAHYIIQAEDHVIISILNLNVPIRILENLPDKTFLLGGKSLQLSVRAFGHPHPFYQWYKDGQRLEAEIHSTLEICQTSFEHAGSYFCEVHNNAQEMVRSNVTRVFIDLVIKEHPTSCDFSLGEKIFFKCEVWGTTNLTYQWFKDEHPLYEDDDSHIKGSNTNRLQLFAAPYTRLQGWYQCKVSSSSGHFVYTRSALLQEKTELQTKHTAVDKVALLIGNSDYRGLDTLNAPKNDVKTLSIIFQSLGFKVVSLIDLTKSEMISTIDAFKELVADGVYCVFYFCGHGFEINGQRFLVPVDVPILHDYTNCVGAEEMVQNILLERKPRLCCMILDCCRELKESSSKPASLVQAIDKANLIVFYATSIGLSAYESMHGILVKHLKNFLSQPITIESVFSKVRESIPKDTRVNKDRPQIPEARSNLSEPTRSLADPIDYSGYTGEYTRRHLVWLSAHKKPETIDLTFPFEKFNVMVRVEFQQEFTNVLKVFVSVIDPGPTEHCLAYVSSLSEEVAETPKIKVSGQSPTLRQTFVTIGSLQRIISDLKIDVTVKCGFLGKDLFQTIRENLGHPLVANLQLCQ